MNKKVIIRFAILLIVVTVAVLIIFKLIPYKKYNNTDFNIKTYTSNIDKDNDGTDDQTDILNNAKQYIETKPKYESRYYGTGYPDDEYGVCTDVVGIAMKNAGYDLMELVNDDIMQHRDDYDIEEVDKNIDFRRVRNLDIYFKRTAIVLTTDINDIENWQGGDIVVFKDHIGIVSDKRNSKGITYILHHANPFQINYEEDILEMFDSIVGHYRIS